MKKAVTILALILLHIQASASPLWTFMLEDATGRNRSLISADTPSAYIILEEGQAPLYISGGKKMNLPASEFKAPYVFRNYILKSPQDYIEILVRSDFRTEIRHFGENGRILTTDSVEVPCRNGLVFKGSYILYGDWGHLYRMTGKRLEAIENPFESHIITACPGGADTLWFSVRHQEIYAWSNGSFTPFPVELNRGIDITTIQTGQGNRVYALNRNGDLFTRSGASFHHSENLFSGRQTMDFQVFPGIAQDTILYFGDHDGLYLRSGSHCDTLSLPVRDRMMDMVILGRDSCVIMGQRGELLQLRKSRYAPFHNKAFDYYVEGSPYDTHNGAVFLYANRDNLPDLLILNGSRDSYTRLYLNQKNAPFQDASYGSGLEYLSENDIVAIADVDGDEYTDLISGSNTANGWSFTIYRNDGHTHFAELSSYLTDLRSLQYLRDLEIMPYRNSLLLLPVFYYSDDMGKGSISPLNILWRGHSLGKNTILPPAPRSWYSVLTPESLDSSGSPVCIAGTYWARDLQLFTNQTDTLRTTRIDTIGNTIVNLPCDLDRDEINELITLSSAGHLTILKKSDSGTYMYDDLTTEVHRLCGSETPHFITVLDYNNDSYPDLFLNGRNRNFLLLNENGHSFRDITEQVQLLTPPVDACITADVNQNGQMDLYAVGNRANVLWMNQNQNQTFLSFLIKSKSMGEAAAWVEISLYPSGSAFRPENCVGFKTGGSDNGSPNFRNSPQFHFGLPEPGYYDARIRFPGGRERILRHLKNGSFLTVDELSASRRMLSVFAARLLHQSLKPETYIYFLLLSAFILSLFLSVHSGIRQFKWRTMTVNIHIISANLLFWGSLFVFHDFTPLIRYGAPIILNLSAFFLAWFFSYQVARRHRAVSVEETRFALLQELLVFSHGNWAMSTINGLIMLCGAVSSHGDTLPTELENQLNERRKTFTGILYERLSSLINMAEKLPEFQEESGDIRTAASQVVELLSASRHDRFAEIQAELRKIKDFIHNARGKVYVHYSCDLPDILNHIRHSYWANPENHSIGCTQEPENTGSVPVMIPSADLADILDNLFQNSIRALRDRTDPQIFLKISRTGSRITLDFCDNGPGVPRNLESQIFEPGMSNYGSSGTGLAHARDYLNKYGASITLRENIPGKGCCFRIELMEGVL